MQWPQGVVVTSGGAGCGSLPVFLLGVMVGVILGWAFHSVVGVIVALVLLLPLIAIAIFAFMAWQGTRAMRKATESAVVVQEAQWHEIDPQPPFERNQ